LLLFKSFSDLQTSLFEIPLVGNYVINTVSLLCIEKLCASTYYIRAALCCDWLIIRP